MNQVAITALQEFTGKEFMYSDWLIRILPYTVIAGIVMYFWYDAAAHESED